jgi:hypothetical protein
MNYEELSDFEINKAVAISLGKKVSAEQYMDFGDRDENVVLCDLVSRMDEGVNYCNNPSDAWPIILENKISTSWAHTCNGVVFWKAVITNQGQPGELRRIEWHDENPLRAAMIVFLKMQNKD